MKRPQGSAHIAVWLRCVATILLSNQKAKPASLLFGCALAICSLLSIPAALAVNLNGTEIGLSFSPRYRSFETDSQNPNAGPHDVHTSLFAARIDSSVFTELNSWSSISVNLNAIQNTSDYSQSIKSDASVRELLLQIRQDEWQPQIDVGRKILGNGVAKGRNPVDYFDSISHYVDDDLDFLQNKLANRIGQIGLGLEWINDVGNLQLFAAPKIGKSEITQSRSNAQQSLYARFAPLIETGPLHVDMLAFRAEGRSHLGYALTSQLNSGSIVYLEGDVSDKRSFAMPTSGADNERRLHAYHNVSVGIEQSAFRHFQLVGEFSYNAHGLSTAERQTFYQSFASPQLDIARYGSALALLSQIGQLGQRYAYGSIEYATDQRAGTIALNVLMNLDDHSSVDTLASRVMLDPHTTFYLIFKRFAGGHDSEFGLIAGNSINIGLEFKY